MNTHKHQSIAIIPARGGSKRLSKKNLQPLNGKPLVGYTLKAAIQSNCFDKILLSSDSEEILELGQRYQKITSEPRPERLSGDRVTALELVCEIVDRPDVKKSYNVVALLLPTCPFRKAEHIRAGFEQLDETVDGVVSLTEYEFPPQLSVTVQDDQSIKPVFEPCPLITGNTRSQDQEIIYRPNGGFYIAWMKSFQVNRNFWKGKVRGYPMPRLASVDIDDQNDLNYAQFLLKQGIYQLDS